MNALDYLTKARLAGYKPELVWVVFANGEQYPFWKFADSIVEIIVRPTPAALRLDLRPLVGCDVILIAGEQGPVLREFIKRLQKVAIRITAYNTVTLPEKLGYAWQRGEQWREIGGAKNG